MMFFDDLAGHCSTHDKPHEQFDPLCSRIAYKVVNRIPSQRFGIAHDLFETHEIEFLVDVTCSIAIELVRQPTSGEDENPNIFFVRLDSTPNRLTEFVAARRTRKRKL